MGVHCFGCRRGSGGRLRPSVDSVTKRFSSSPGENRRATNLKKELDAANQARTEREGAVEEANSEIEKRQSEIMRLSAEVERLTAELKRQST
jgi:predicted  nucleic acid-binding Zn-ribbon protein